MSVLPVAAEPPAEDQEQREREQRHAVNGLLAGAGEAGRRAAGWVRDLAARQTEEAHRTVLGRAADAVKQARGQEVVPGGEGQLDEELAYDLGASVVTGSPLTAALPELAAGERVALAAVCAVGAAMPSAVLGELERELPALAATMDAAVGVGRTAAPGPEVQRSTP
ncbi:hypothetical protein ACIQI7_31970 [Kitasatospora sp. NPDC092039]|uniref:hypothetical protein n=1 Tax=Kitasatospora sp. NPDC092039 TaxID=3364086 RepID=UPI00382A5F65